MGLSATIKMQSDISNKNTEDLYRSSRRAWSIARGMFIQTKNQGAPDFALIMKAEARIRQNMLRMLFERAAEFGSTENGRVKSSDDDTGPVNQRLNAGGAALRGFAMTMYPFPDPLPFGYRTRGLSKARKKFRVAGYEASCYGPRTPLVHTDLPSLDFGDIVRSQIEYLTAYSSVQGMSVKDWTRYVNLLLLLARPFLDCVYTEHRCGLPDFRTGVSAALRSAKEDITRHYSPLSGEEATVTDHLVSGKPVFSTEFFGGQVREAKLAGIEHPAVGELERILRGGHSPGGESERPCLTEKDVEHIWNMVLKRARRDGSRTHRYIARLFDRPWRLRDAILRGDEFNPRGRCLVVSEVPLETSLGAGRADLVLLQREALSDGLRVLWRPVMVLDTKTRSGYEWALSNEELESESRASNGLPPRVVPDFLVRSRPMDYDEWEEIIKATPNPSTSIQTEAYSSAVNDEYCRISDVSQNRILTGTLLLNPSRDIHFSREFYSALFIKAYETVAAIKTRISRTVFEPLVDGASVGVALVIHEQPAVGQTQNTAIEPPWHPAYDPLDGATEGGRKLILYLAGESPTSAGWSAAWIARYHHGLQMLYELAKEKAAKDVIWLDLADQFTDAGLAEARLSLRPYSYSEQDVLKSQPDHIRVFFEGIRKVGLWSQVYENIFADGPVPEIGQLVKTSADSHKIIVVSGWDTVQNATPEPYRDRLDHLLSYIIVQLPDDANTDVLWFDSPVPGESSSIPYSTRTLLPFYQGSALMGEVNEIVWNLPVAPKSTVTPGEWSLPVIPGAPMYDDIRVIVREHLEGFDMELILVPQLIGWSRRFRSLGLGLVTPENVVGVEESVPERETRDRMKVLALSMVPWLVNLWPDTTLDEETGAQGVKTVYKQTVNSRRARQEPMNFSNRTIPGPPIQEPSLLERLRFRPRGSAHGRGFVPVTLGRINSQRLYRKPNRIKTKRKRRLKPAEVRPQIPTETFLYGQAFTAEDGSMHWIGMEDPQSPSRILIGCFSNRSPDERGFVWSETDTKQLIESFSDEALSLPCTSLTFRKVEGGLELWTFDEDAQDPVFSGLKQIVSGGEGSVGLLRAIGGQFGEELPTGPPAPGPPAHFRSRIERAFARWKRSLEDVKIVTPVLKVEADICVIELLNDEGEGHVITLDSTADLIQLLKYPLSKGRLRTDSAVYVTWNPFESIDYGPLDSLRGLVETRSSGAIAESLPVRVRDLLEPNEGELEIELSHSKKSCPLARGGDAHGQCWHVRVLSECPSKVKRQLEKNMTAKEVYRVLGPGIIKSGGTYSLQLSFKPPMTQDESVVFRENGWLRRLLSDLGYKYAFAKVGSYLRIEQKRWRVKVTLRLDEMMWAMDSIPRGLPMDDTTRSMKLDFTNNVQEESARILSAISRDIPKDKIIGYHALVNDLRVQLRAYGFGKKSPPCRIDLKARGDELEYVLTLTSETRRLPVYDGRIKLDSQSTPESVIEGINEMLDEGELSAWNVPDRNGLQDQVEGVLEELGRPKETDIEDEELGGPEGIEVEDEQEGPMRWNVEVFEQNCCMMWTATDSNSPKEIGPERWADDLKDLLAGTIAKKVKEFQDLFGSDIEKRLGVVDNRNEVLRKQIPKALRDIRQKCGESQTAAGS